MGDLPFLHLLQEGDAAAAAELRRTLSQKYHRGNRVEHFSDCLALVASFVDGQSQDVWKRALVCGVCQMDNGLAVNNARLQIFSGRSKSSINDLLAKMRYRTVAIHHENQAAVIAKIPYLSTDNNEFRQWTYRVPERAFEIGIPGCTGGGHLLEKTDNCAGEARTSERKEESAVADAGCSGFDDGQWGNFLEDDGALT
jgi:hypothetical protein